MSHQHPQEQWEAVMAFVLTSVVLAGALGLLGLFVYDVVVGRFP